MKGASKVSAYISSRIEELKSKKTQKEIAKEAGYTRPNNMSMIKQGVSKVPLERIPALAKALECDVGELFAMALEQYYSAETILAFRRAMTADLSPNELEWIEFLRTASGENDPKLTAFHKKLLTPLLKPSGSPR